MDKEPRIEQCPYNVLSDHIVVKQVRQTQDENRILFIPLPWIREWKIQSKYLNLYYDMIIIIKIVFQL